MRFGRQYYRNTCIHVYIPVVSNVTIYRGPCSNPIDYLVDMPLINLYYL